ncbi:SRPBCC family protein [Mycobacterium sp.]|uniref:SRPBCC family protein n=1 Tax=Mycobacterium sp. TaxID=1785 RepID=UPI003A8BE027
MAVHASSEVVIDAPLSTIMDAIADMDALPSWSSVHKRAKVIDTWPDGRPRRVKVVVKLAGVVEKETIEYHWGPDWVAWDALETRRQHAQHCEYRLTRESDDRTRVRFTVTIETSALLPEFVVNRVRDKLLRVATEGLRQQVLASAG